MSMLHDVAGYVCHNRRMSLGELVLRILAAGALGGVVGAEREYSGQQAGFRTHILVSLGAALFTIAGAYPPSALLSGHAVGFDPTRIAAQVVTGIGFLGAGAIVRHGVTVRGLTTAASLWVTAAIGIAVGLGYWTAAAITAGATLASLVLLKGVERVALDRAGRVRTELLIATSADLRLADLAQGLEWTGARLYSLRFLGKNDAGHNELLATMLLGSGKVRREIADQIKNIEGVERVDLSN
ncbi:MAG: MgtC/SapB family protein [Actinomycetota bacterium]|nr:MgtC/SapB family protein [Actinomycetota bacterium]